MLVTPTCGKGGGVGDSARRLKEGWVGGDLGTEAQGEGWGCGDVVRGMLGTRCGRQGTVCGLEKGEGAGEGDPDAGVCAGLGCAAFGDDNSTTVTNRDPSGAQDLALFAVAFAGNFRRGGGVREGGSRGGGGSFIPKARERRGPRGRKSPVVSVCVFECVPQTRLR